MTSVLCCLADSNAQAQRLRKNDVIVINDVIFVFILLQDNVRAHIRQCDTEQRQSLMGLVHVSLSLLLENNVRTHIRQRKRKLLQR